MVFFFNLNGLIAQFVQFPARGDYKWNIDVVNEKIVNDKKCKGQHKSVFEDEQELFHESNFVNLLESFAINSACFTQDGVILAAHEVFQRATGYRS